MSKEVVKYTSSDETKDVSVIKSSLNTTLYYKGDAINNKIYVSNKIYQASKSVKKDDLSAIVRMHQCIMNMFIKIKYFWYNFFGLNGQKEVFSNDQKIMQLIWKYLSYKDKMNCTLVCRRFNRIISEMDHFHIRKKLTSKFQIIPTLTRNYSTVKFLHYKCDNLEPLMNQMINHFNKSLKHFTLDHCQFEMMTLNDILYKLPMLESLQLNLTLKTEKDVEISPGSEPKLVQLKVLMMKVNDDMLEEVLVMLSSASNLESISFVDAKFDIDLVDCLKQYKSLTSLSLTNCIIDTPSYMSNLNALQFDSSVKLLSLNYDRFNSLENLRKLELIEVNDEMLRILKSRCAFDVTDLKIIYNNEQINDVHIFFDFLTKANNYYVFSPRQNRSFKRIDMYKISTYHNGIEPIDKKFIHYFLVAGQKKIEYYMTDDETKNLDENSNTLSFKISNITTYDSTIEGSKLEFYDKLHHSFPLCSTHWRREITEKCDEGRTPCIVLNMVNPSQEKIDKIINDFSTRLKEYRSYKYEPTTFSFN